MERDYLLDLIRSPKTIFTFKDIVLLWGESDVSFIKKKINRYVKAGKINAVRKGIYSKDKNYDKYELAGYKVLFDTLKYLPKNTKVYQLKYDFGLREAGASKINYRHVLYYFRSLFK